MSTPDAETAYEAARRFVDTWSELAATLTDDYGCTLCCGEADALAHLFRVFHRPDVADALIAAHAKYDEEPEDLHYQESEAA